MRIITPCYDNNHDAQRQSDSKVLESISNIIDADAEHRISLLREINRRRFASHKLAGVIIA